MNKTIYVILTIISLLLFVSLIFYAIVADKLTFAYKNIGFLIVGYASIILFAISWFKLTSKK